MESLYYLPRYEDTVNVEDWIYEQLPYLLEKNNISIDKENEKFIKRYIASHIYTLIFNICGLNATLVKLHSKKNSENMVVKPKHLKSSLDYVKSQCYPELITKQSGGSYVIDSEYFGKNTNNYTTNAGTDLLDIKFGSDGIIRPEIAMSGGKSINSHELLDIDEIIKIIIENTERKNLFPDNEIIDILSKFDVSIKNNSLKILKKILKMHVNCLFLDLRNHSPLTIKKIDKILSLKRHAVFN